MWSLSPHPPHYKGGEKNDAMSRSNCVVTLAW